MKDTGWPLGQAEATDTTGLFPGWGDRLTGSYCLAWKQRTIGCLCLAWSARSWLSRCLIFDITRGGYLSRLGWHR